MQCNKKYNKDAINQELLASIIEIVDEEDYSGLNKDVKQPKEAIFLIRKYEQLLKGENRKIINIVGKQGELLQKFKESNEFYSRVGLSRSNIYFKKPLHKFLCKYTVLKKSILTSGFFKSNFKLIKKVNRLSSSEETFIQ